MAQHQAHRNIAGCVDDLKTKDKLLSSIHKISSLLTKPISLDKILTSIVKETSQVFGFTRLAIFLADRDRNLLECRYIHGFSPHDSERARRFPYRMDLHDCVETRVAKRGKTIFVRDYEEDPRVTAVDLKVSRIMRRVSTIAVPLKIKKDVIGLITADKDDIRLAMTRKDIAAFSTFANQASIVIENARLQEQNQKKIKQLLTLQEISKKTSSTFHLEKLFHVIAASALKITKATSSALFLVEDDGKQLALASAKGFDAAKKGQHIWKIGSGLVGHVALTGSPILAGNGHDHGGYREVVPGMQAQLAVPLSNDRRVIGVLYVGSQERAAFSEDDLKLLLIFAGHTASLLRNVKLYGQVMTERNFRENILESSPNSVVTVDLKKEITSINKKTEEMFRIRRRYVLGMPAGAIFPGDIAQVIEGAIDRRTVVDSKEIRLERKDGGAGVLGITSSLLRNHQGDLIGAMIIIRDLTEEKKTEELIRRIDRLTSLGQLSAGIAHEIRNPLSSINFNVQLLAKKSAVSETAKSLIADTQVGIDRIRTLVKGMLDFAKPSLPSLKSDSLLRVVQGSIGLMDSQLKENKVEVRCELPDSLPEVILDAHQIQQVLVNLLLNSMEAMPEGGTIHITGRVIKGAKKRCEQVVLQVIDQGQGIARDDLSRIFNPFFTTKAEGTGLGLSIVHKILEQHHATVDVVSYTNRGTTFTLKFPVHHAEEARCTATGF